MDDDCLSLATSKTSSAFNLMSKIKKEQNEEKWFN